MKKLFKRMLALGLSLCLLLCVPVAASAEDEDLLSHYNGDDEEYYAFLWNHFRVLYEDEYNQDPDSASIQIENAVSREMADMFNATRSDFEHPYLRGTIDTETGEITITGMRASGSRIVSWLDENTQQATRRCIWYYQYVTDLVIPDSIDGHPVTKIQNKAFAGSTNVGNDKQLNQYVQSVCIGDSVREIGNAAFTDLTKLQKLHLGDNVQIIEDNAFFNNDLHKIKSWGNRLQFIGKQAFVSNGNIETPVFPLPETVESIGYLAFFGIDFPETYAVPKSVRTMDVSAFSQSIVKKLVVLNPTMEFVSIYNTFGKLFASYVSDACLYCYAGSTAETYAKQSGDPYCLINGDSLLWDGKAVEENALAFGVGMTEEELRSHLSVDGASSEIQIDGLQDGKVAGGTTITLFHTVAQAPGKVYTVEKKAEPVSVSVETLPTKTNYFYKEAFDPSGLSLRVAYDDGTETVVTDGITLTGTDLTVGTNTITATYENCSTTFTVTVRLPQAVRVSVETLPTKTNYFYKEAFDPSGLSLRVAYDDGTETVVTDGVACTGTDLKIGTNTITATYENRSVTFPITVRYSWWQKLIRVLLFGFLWY